MSFLLNASRTGNQGWVWHLFVHSIIKGQKLSFNVCLYALPLQAPIDFILKGRLSSGEKVGLELLEGIKVRVLVLYSSAYGCGQLRGRIYIIGLRTSDEALLDSQLVQLIAAVAQLQNMRGLPLLHPNCMHKKTWWLGTWEVSACEKCEVLAAVQEPNISSKESLSEHVSQSWLKLVPGFALLFDFMTSAEVRLL